MPSAVLDKLRSIVGANHVLTGIELSPYVVDGRTPDAAVFPGTVDEVRSVVALAAENGASILPWGGGTAMSVGNSPSRTGIVLGLRRLDRLIEHEPGDLTATAQAGILFDRFQTVLRERGQWLSLDAPDTERATLGGVLGANASGPRRHLYGTARDQLIGVSVVMADGALIKGGGKVVKNVAGYDLPKLFIGSYGTLGIMVEVTVKLRPRPDEEQMVAFGFDRLTEADAVLRRVMSSDLIPSVLDLHDAEGARLRGLPEKTVVLVVCFDGLGEQVEWQIAELEKLIAGKGQRLDVAIPPDDYVRLWGSAALAEQPPAAVMRLSVLPTRVADLIERGATAAKIRGLRSAWNAHAGVGVVLATLLSPGDQGDANDAIAVLSDWRTLAKQGSGYATLEWAPLAVKARVPVWDDLGAAGRIMQRIKTQLDPKSVFNPGRFVASI